MIPKLLKRPTVVTLTGVSLGILSVILTLLAYMPGMEAGFYLDDKSSIVWVSALHWEAWSMDGVISVLTGSQLTTRPLPNISFALNHLVGGLEPYGYHLTNLVIHLATGLSLWWVAMLMARDGEVCSNSKNKIILCSLAVTTIYLVHPLNIQAVTYVVQRMTSMAALFVLLSFGCYLLARRNRGTVAVLGFSASALCWLLAMASKEIAIQLPLVLLLYEACFHRDFWKVRLGRLSIATVFSARGIFVGAILILVSTYILKTYNPESHFHWYEQFPGRDFSGVERLLTQSRVQFFYLTLVLWASPSRLNIEHDFIVSQSLWQPWTTILAASGWIIALVVLLYFAKAKPRLAFPLLAYMTFHLLESGPINLEMVFEHRMYLPMAFLALFLNSVLLSDFVNWKVAVLVVYMLALPLAYATYERNKVWSNELEFLRDSAEKSPNNFRSWYNLGSRLGESGYFAEAEEVLQKALKLKPKKARPNHAWAHNQLGNVYKLTGRLTEAIEQYQLALKAEPTLRIARRNLLRTELLKATGK